MVVYPTQLGQVLKKEQTPSVWLLQKILFPFFSPSFPLPLRTDQRGLTSPTITLYPGNTEINQLIYY